VLNPALLKYVLTSDNATCFIVPLSFVTTLSASTNVVAEADVSPSMIFNSVAVDVTPSSMFSSAAVEVTPSSIFNSSGVDVIAVLLAAANTGIVPDWFGKLIVLSAVGSTMVSVVSLLSAVAPSKTTALAASIVTVFTVVVVPATLKLPATATLAPSNVKAVVVPDFNIKLPLVFVALPNVVPPSLKKMSPPSASNIMSVVASSVIVEPESISAITGVVNVLFVSVSVELAETKVVSPPVLGSVRVLDALSECGAPCTVCACALLDSQ